MVPDVGRLRDLTRAAFDELSRAAGVRKTRARRAGASSRRGKEQTSASLTAAAAVNGKTPLSAMKVSNANCAQYNSESRIHMRDSAAYLDRQEPVDKR